MKVKDSPQPLIGGQTGNLTYYVRTGRGSGLFCDIIEINLPFSYLITIFVIPIKAWSHQTTCKSMAEQPECITLGTHSFNC